MHIPSKVKLQPPQHSVSSFFIFLQIKVKEKKRERERKTKHEKTNNNKLNKVNITYFDEHFWLVFQHLILIQISNIYTVLKHSLKV